jgi:nucleoside-diphosphate-sugar epimerase
MLEAEYRTERGLQLHAPPFAAYKKLLTHHSDYAATQQLGSKMQQAGIEAFEFTSARDPVGGVNVALFTPDALPRNEPASKESWLCELTGPMPGSAPYTSGRFMASRWICFWSAASFPNPREKPEVRQDNPHQ